jgi:chlorophyll(ide) b reductase
MIKIKNLNSLKSERLNKKQLNVVITGGTRGLGRAFTNEFSKKGDNVFILSRSQKDIDILKNNSKFIYGKQCDIKNKDELQYVINNDILKKFNTIDVWINNAGMSGGSRNLIDLDNDKIKDIIETNLLGSCISCKLMYEIMSKQKTGGSIFNLAGAGSNGSASPLYSVYGSTKAGIVQLSKSLQNEWKNSNVDLHIISPGMMLTELLTENASDETIEFIQFLCAQPELVAMQIVPKIRKIYYNVHENQYIKFLTLLKIIGKFITYKLQ